MIHLSLLLYFDFQNNIDIVLSDTQLDLFFGLLPNYMNRLNAVREKENENNEIHT